MYGWNWVRNAAYPTLKPTQDVLGNCAGPAGIGYRIVIGPEEPGKCNWQKMTAQSERQARAAAHANTSIM